jgi:DNA primase
VFTQGGVLMDKKKIKAKLVPIESLYPDKNALRQFGSRLRGNCPFHRDEHNPNFFIYTATNTWYCFVEKKGGDSISFLMKLKNIDFKTALEELA